MYICMDPPHSNPTCAQTFHAAASRHSASLRYKLAARREIEKDSFRARRIEDDKPILLVMRSCTTDDDGKHSCFVLFSQTQNRERARV